MRFIAIILGILLLLFGSTYWVLFTSSGNNLLVPIIEKKVQEAIDAPFKVELFRLKPSSLKLNVLYQNSISAKVDGDFSILSKTFDMDYHVFGDKVVTPALTINERIEIDGSAKGSLEDFSLKGIGVVFEAPATYDARIKKTMLSNATISLENASIEKLLGLASQPILTKGRASLKVNVVDDNGKPSGVAKLEIFDGAVDTEVVEAQYGTKLPSSVTYQAVFKASMEDNEVKADGLLDSNIAKIFIKYALFDVESKVLNSKFDLNIEDLSKLTETVGMALQGKFEANGDLSLHDKDMKITVNSNSFGGDLEAVYHDDKLSAKGEKMAIEKILFTLVQPPLAKAHMNFKADMESVEKLKGVVHAKVQNGTLFGKELKSLVDLEWPKTVGFGANIDAVVDSEDIDFKVDLDSTLANLSGIEGSFNTKTMTLESIYALEVSDLSKLAFLTGRSLNGPLQANGNVKYADDKPYFDTKTDVVGGKTTLVFEDDIANFKAKDFSMERISEVVGVPYVFNATGDANATYNVSEEQGEFSIQIPQGHLLENELVRLVQVATGFNMLTETYTDTSLRGIIKNQMVGYDFDMEGKQSFMKVKQGTFNLDSQAINAPFELQVKNKDLAGAIKGKISSPKVEITVSKYIGDKIEKELDRHLDEDSKNLLKGLKKLF